MLQIFFSPSSFLVPAFPRLMLFIGVGVCVFSSQIQ